MYQASVAPVKEGDEVKVTIEAVGAKGDGIAKVDGFVLFVAGTRQGDHVLVRITRVLRNVGFAEVVRKEEAQQEVVETPVHAPVEPEPIIEDSEDFGEE
jgi:predicted RNA-binding protein with TRAM domain